MDVPMEGDQDDAESSEIPNSGIPEDAGTFKKEE